MIRRNIQPFISQLSLDRHKMAFISGPRQCGKTTLVKNMIPSKEDYFNWDNPAFKKQWVSQIESFTSQVLNKSNPIIALDEFHKNPKWKNQIKGFYDQYAEHIQILVTGSAKLNVYRKGADSLLGRFLHFHLDPLTINEVVQKKTILFEDLLHRVQNFEWLSNSKKEHVLALENLLKFSGFPEPFKSQKESIYNLWSKSRNELLVREDIPENSQLLRTNQVDILALLLPGKVGSPLSIQNLKEDLDVAHTTVSRWMNALSSVYYHFLVPPFSKKIIRSLKKESKIYLYDWAQIESPGIRFENLIASHLLKMVHYYNDSGQAQLTLHYLRNKDKQEVDFLICQKGEPLFSVEAKVSDLNLDMTFKKFQTHYKFPHYQIVQKPNIYRKFQTFNACVISFDLFFSLLP